MIQEKLDYQMYTGMRNDSGSMDESEYDMTEDPSPEQGGRFRGELGRIFPGLTVLSGTMKTKKRIKNFIF